MLLLLQHPFKIAYSGVLPAVVYNFFVLNKIYLSLLLRRGEKGCNLHRTLISLNCFT